MTAKVLEAVKSVWKVKCSKNGRRCGTMRPVLCSGFGAGLSLVEEAWSSDALLVGWVSPLELDVLMISMEVESAETVSLLLDCIIRPSLASSQARSMRRLARDHHTGPSQLLKTVWSDTARTLKPLFV